MAAEALPIGESSAPRTTLSRGQFNLRSLFVFTLRISPLFVALVFLRQELSGQPPPFAMVLNVLVCAAIYGGIFAARAELRRLRQADKPPGRSVMPAIRKGGFHGALFQCLALGPAILAQILIAGRGFERLAWWQKKALSPLNMFDFLWELGGRLMEFAMIVGICAFFGFVLGAAGGAVAGAVIEARKQ